MGENGKYRPFSNGTEYMIWFDHNCDECVKYDDDYDNPPKCPIARAISWGACSDGSIPDAIVERVKWDPEQQLHFPSCPEKETK